MEICQWFEPKGINSSKLCHTIKLYNSPYDLRSSPYNNRRKLYSSHKGLCNFPSTYALLSTQVFPSFLSIISNSLLLPDSPQQHHFDKCNNSSLWLSISSVYSHSSSNRHSHLNSSRFSSSYFHDNTCSSNSSYRSPRFSPNSLNSNCSSPEGSNSYYSPELYICWHSNRLNSNGLKVCEYLCTFATPALRSHGHWPLPCQKSGQLRQRTQHLLSQLLIQAPTCQPLWRIMVSATCGPPTWRKS
ncbi:uncharacterized protein LOC101852026 isoform X2 [Aplysia californica]|uniref:Uncharacterized protein LOC101852026 isoform X2 n=1 Tax=Aplysia californica TaxID=6500 RepID=A0ABM1VUJ5_APLCA|nr:uncharacterized protein LOC101852026 isoform X2 [Aplysia californica]XP_035826088.1 uncharacterized protein LOC101852026 isoform X2 [Aplysia californica]